MKWPSDYLGLFIILSDDKSTKQMLRIKRDEDARTSTERKFVETFVREMSPYVGETDFDTDAFDIDDYLEEKNILDNLFTIRNANTTVAQSDIINTIEDNIVKLVQNIENRLGRSKFDKVVSQTREGKEEIKPLLIDIQTQLGKSTKDQREKFRNRFLKGKKSLDLIKLAEENQDRITVSNFSNPEKVNINKSLLKITIKGSALENNEATDLKNAAKNKNFVVNMSGKELILKKIFNFAEINNKMKIKNIMNEISPLILEKDKQLEGKAITVVVDHSHLRNFLIEEDKTLRDFDSSAQIEVKTEFDLVAEEDINEARIKDYFALLLLSENPIVTAYLTNFKINDKEIYNVILNGPKNKKTYKSSLYLTKVLTNPSTQNIFEDAMKNIVKEEVLPEKMYREYMRQQGNWKVNYKGKRTPDRTPNTEAGKQYLQNYDDLTAKGTLTIPLMRFLKEERRVNFPEGSYEILNPEAVTSAQIVILTKRNKRVDALLEKPRTQKLYKRWLKDNNIADSREAKKGRFAPSVPKVEGLNLENESKFVQTVFSIMDGGLQSFLGSRTELPKLFGAINIRNSLKVYYHTINDMTNVDVKSAVVKVDKLSKDSKAKKQSLLSAVKDLSDKFNEGLIQFKQSFTEELKKRLKDIEENPNNYLTLYKENRFKKQLILFNLFDKRDDS